MRLILMLLFVFLSSDKHFFITSHNFTANDTSQPQIDFILTLLLHASKQTWLAHGPLWRNSLRDKQSEGTTRLQTVDQIGHVCSGSHRTSAFQCCHGGSPAERSDWEIGLTIMCVRKSFGEFQQILQCGALSEICVFDCWTVLWLKHCCVATSNLETSAAAGTYVAI